MQYRLHKAIRLFARLVCGGLMGGHINGYMFSGLVIDPMAVTLQYQFGSN
jgi:hypothetical protein